MPQSPYIEIAHRLMAPGANSSEQPSYCREVAARLRADGEVDLADQLERAARPPEPWLGSSTTM